MRRNWPDQKTLRDLGERMRDAQGVSLTTTARRNAWRKSVASSRHPDVWSQARSRAGARPRARAADRRAREARHRCRRPLPMHSSCSRWPSRGRRGCRRRHRGASCPQLEARVRALEFKRMFRGEMDAHSAYLDIQAGAGGTEAQDWAQMLLRMYLRWGAARGFKCEVMDSSPGEVAGIKSATIAVRGRVRLWLAAHRDRRAPAGAQEPVRFGQPPPHVVRVGVRLAGDRRRHQHRDQPGGHRDGRVSAPAAPAAST